MQPLEDFIQRTLALSDDGLLSAPFDPAWPSPAEQYQVADTTYWRPVPQHPPISFAGLENALELTIHPDITAYYSHCWSATLQANSEEGELSLIQLWNQDDFDRLIANLIGHAMAKQKKRQPYTVFFANADPDSELFLSIDNTTGKILLEEPGQPPIKEVESDISTFLNRLEPDLSQPDLY